MIDEQDRRVAEGLQAGKAEAWTALYEAWFDRVWQLAARMVGPDAAAVADVVQETFLAAARSARSFDPARGSLWLWLAGITRNQAAMHFRQRRRDARVQQGGDLHDELAGLLERRLRQGPAGPDGLALAAEEAQLVRCTLAGLSDDHQSLLARRYFDDMPIEEIARRADCTVSAVRSKLARARQVFRHAYARLCGRGEGASHEQD